MQHLHEGNRNLFHDWYTNSNIGNVNAGADVKLNFDMTTLKVKDINAKGNVTLLAGDEEIYTGNISSNKDIDFGVSYGSISSGNLLAGGNIGIGAGRAGFITAKNISSAQDINLTLWESELTAGNITVKGNLTGIFDNEADPSSLITGNINVGKDFIINGLGRLSSGSINAGHSINISVGTYQPTDKDINTGKLTANSDILLSTPNTINTGDITTKGNLTAGDLQSNGTLTKAQSITMKNITAGKNVDLSAHTVTTGTIKAGGTITIDKD